MKKTVMVINAFIMSCMFMCVTASLAANGVWNGTVDALWTNSANWSASPYPSGSETASFTNAGNGQTTIDVAGLTSIKTITFDSPFVAAYTNGTGMTNSQTLVLLDNGEIKLTGTAANSQAFNCGIQLGADRGGQPYSFRNDSLAQTLTLNNVFGAASGGTAGDKTLTINGVGNVSILGNVSRGGANKLYITDNNSAALQLYGSNTVATLNMNGGTNSVVDIGSGFLALDNGGGTSFTSSQGGTINGTGTLWFKNQGDNSVAAGKTVVINAPITSDGILEIYGNTGTFVLNATNTVPGEIQFNMAGAISVWKVGNKGSIDSNLGKGTNINFNANASPGAKLIYTGSGEDSDRTIIVNYNAIIDQSGTGLLKFTAPLTASGATKTLTLQGSTSGVGEIAGAIPNAVGTFLAKSGSGTWILSAVNTYTGMTTVAGGTLLINSPGSIVSPVTVNKGGLLGGDGIVKASVTLATGGMLAPAKINTFGTLSITNALTLNGNGLFFDIDASNVSTDKVAVAGAMTVNGTNTVYLAFPSGIAPVGTNTLITFGSQSGSGTFVLAPGYANGYLMMDATSLSLVVTNTGIYGLSWKGNESGVWNLVTPNWTNGTTAATYTEGDAVTFDDTASSFTVTGDTAVNPGSVVFNNTANAYTVSAAIAGTTELFKLGSATTTLSGTNTYSGQTTILSGKLKIDGAGQMGAGSYAGNMANAGIFEYASTAMQINSGVISGIGELAVSGAGTLTLSGDNAYSGPTTVSGSGTLILSGSNTLSGTTMVNGPGTLIISGNNASSSGQTIINAGVLKALNANALGTTAAGTTVNVGGALELVSGVTFAAEPLALNGTLSCLSSNCTYSGTITPQNGSFIEVGAGLTLTVSAATAGGATVNGFTKKGTGKLLFTADPNNAGAFIIDEGTIELNHGGATDAAFIIAPGSMLREIGSDRLGDNYNVTNNGIFEMWGNDKIAGLSGNGLVTRGNNTAGTLTVGGNNLSGAFSGVIENGLGTINFTKDGTGIQSLSGVNTYIGPTTVNAGTLLVNNPGSLALLSPVTVANGAILGGNGTVNGPVTLSAGGILAPGGANTIDTLKLGSSLMLNSGTLLFDISNVATDKVEVAAALTLFGVNTVAINGSLPIGDYTLMTFASLAGPGTFSLLDPSSAWLEPTATSLILHVTSGSSGAGLTWAGDKSLVWDSVTLNWLNGSTSSLFATGDAVLFDDTALNYTVNSGSAVSPASVLFNNSVNVYTVNAIIGGAASVTKFGTVNANLTGVNTYTGPTIVNQGTLAINNPGQLGSGNYAQPILISGGATFHYASAANQVLSGVMSGSGTFTKSGASTLIVSNANTRTGGTTLSAGTLIAKAFPTALGTGALTFNTASSTLELDSDTGVAFNNNATVSINSTVKSGRLTSGPGVTNTLGTLNMNGAYTLTASKGAGVASGTAGLTFGATTLNGDSTFTVDTGTLLTLGALGGNRNFIKSGVGTLFFGTAGGRTAGNSTLTAGTLAVGNAAGLGTTGTTNVLNGGTLDLAIDTTVSSYITTVGGNTTIQSDKSTPNSEGITHTLGNLTIGAYTLSVTNGPNVRVQSPFGLAFGAVALTANAQFDVANNGAGRGTLTLGAVSGNFSLTKKNVGTLNLVGKNVSTGATIINNGRLVGVTGGASSNSTVTVQSSGPADAGAIMGVLCAGANGQWACNNLIFTNALAPATAVPALEFSFAVTPSTSIAPLLVTNKIVFATNPVVRVYLANLGNIASGTYPLMVASVTAPTNDIPALTVYGGYTGSTLSWSGNTLNLNLTGTAEEPLKWAGTGTGTWDMNVGANLVWTNSATPPAAAYYREVFGSSDQVRFDDTTIGANQTITLNTEVNPLSVTVSNVLYKYTLAGSGSISGPVALNKTAAGTLTLGTANNYSGGTVLSGGTIALGNAAGLPVGSTLSMSGTSTLDLNGFSATIGTISASVAGNTIIDNSIGSGTNTLLLNNQSATISALIKDGPSKAVAVGLMNNNLGTPIPFTLTSASTFSGGLTLKHSAGGTRMYINGGVTTVGNAGNITSSPFGRGPISIGEAPADKAQVWISSAGVAIHNDIIVNTTLGTDQVYAIRNDSVTTALNGAVLANADLSFGTTGTGAVTLTNRISGAGGLKLLAGAITVTLSGPNTYTGKTTVNAGTLIFNSLRNVGEGASALGAPTTVANGTIDLNANMQFNGATTTSDRIFNLTGGSGSLHNTGTGILTLTGGFTGFNYNILVRGSGTIVETGLMNIGNGGIVHTDSGTLILANPLNPFFGLVHTADGVISVDTVADIGQFSSIGRGDRILMGQNSGTIGKFQFTGAAGGAFNRNFYVSGTSATAGGIIENTVAGQTLALNGNIYLGAYGPAPRLQLVGVGDGVVNGTINNTLSILKMGTGTWTFTGANTYTGLTTVAGGTLALSGANGSLAGSLNYAITSGGTLLVDNTSANNADRLRDATPITLGGGTLCITNNAGAMNYGEVAGALYVTNSGGTIATSETAEGMTNALSFTSLTRTGIATLNFIGTGLGESDRNRIFIAGQPNGLIGLWATINTTNFAAYDSSLGVYVAGTGAAFTNIYAKGPSIIPDDATLNARINELGTEGGIGLEGLSISSIRSLLQNTDWQATAVAMTNKTLLVNEVVVSAGNARALTLGTEQNEGFVAPLGAGGDLQLTASGFDSLLTINAAVTNNATASTVSKLGPGKVVLAGTSAYTGATVINAGELAFGGTSDHLRAAVISGAGLLSKSGSGTLNLNVANTYTGGTRVDAGIVNVNNINALSTGAVTNNGTLNIIGGNNVTISGLSLSLSGAGINNVTLGTGVQSTSFNGNYSEFTGTWNIGINGTNGPGRAIMTGLDNSAATINVLSNSTLWVYGAGVHNAAVVLNGGDTGESYGQLRVDTAEWAGPVTLASPITSAADGFIGSANTDGIISGIIGEVNGPYELSKMGANKTTLTGTNTFRGPVWVKAGSISVPSINSVGTGTGPLGSPLTAAQGAIKLGYTTTAGTLIYTGTNAITDRAIELAGTTGGATFDQSGTNALVLAGGMVISGTGNKTLTLQGSTLGTGEFTGSITNGNGSVTSLTKNGTGTWTLSGTNNFTGAVALNNGSLVLSNTSSNSITGGITVKGTGLLTVNGPTTLGGSTLTLGNAAGERTMAVISTDVTMGKLFASYTTAGAAGSVIQNSGTVLVGTNTISADVLSLGTYGGYGYYRKNGGSLATGQLALTGNNNNSNNTGVFDLFGGTVDVVPNNGWLIFGWQSGHGVFNIFDGSVYSPPGNNNATMAFAASRNAFGMLNMLGAGALLDVTGKNNAARWFDLAATAGNKASVLNLNAGVCFANRVGATVATTPTFVNFNGGTLRANVTAVNFLQGLTAATIYPGGAIIDSTNASITVVQPLLAPTDYGVASVNVTSGGAGYIGAPVVMITGGSGTNATAIATVDLNPESVTYGQVTSVQVTSPGVRYQPGDILTVTCIGGGYTNLASATATLGVNSNSGGLTKLGTGALTLGGINTYGGETTISSGTLRLGVANALPTNSVVNVNGGIYDLGAFTVTNRAVNVTSGSVINGTLNSADITKDGAGLLTFGVLQSAAAPIVINGGTMRLKGGAGLYEGRVNGAFELGLPNPQTTVKLSPTNAYTFFANNGASGGIWADNTTYIYSGYIWNRSPTNETWTFCKSFDDSVLIMVDGKPVINVNGNWDVVVTANYVVTPGPHAFEVRLGQGTGGVGQAPNKTVPGAGFDRLGRSNSAFCVPIIDPGDGSLLTLGGKLADASTVELAADALLDLDGTAQTLAGLSGSGTVSNGALTVTGTISPAGTNTIGTLTAKANTTLSGKLLANVATDGTSDLLDVQGNLTLLSPTLEIVDLAGLSTLKMYTLATCSGTLTGTFTPTNLPDRWALRYTTDGKVQLYYKGGTMIRIM